MSADATFPVQVLREHTTALEAAISVCLADPDHKPVHKLRTETRRVEAELLLLSQLPDAPQHRKEADALLKQLKRLRRAAGEVRDLDVHRKILDGYAEPDHPEEGPAADGAGAQVNGRHGAAKKTGSKRRGSARQASPNGSGPDADAQQNAVQEGASDLSAHLNKQRDARASELLKLLKKRQAKAAGAAEALLKVLEPAEDLALSAEDLLCHARALLQRDGLLARGEVAELSKDELHTIRKAAKCARYLAETIPDNAVARKAAEHFESMQEAGGQWHDLLDLAKAARQYLGKSHQLTATLMEKRDRKMQVYRAALESEAGAGARSEEQVASRQNGRVKTGRNGLRKAAAGVRASSASRRASAA